MDWLMHGMKRVPGFGATRNPHATVSRGMSNPHTKILITGAGSGIGRALAAKLAGSDKSLFLTSRSADKLKSIAGEVDAAGSTAADLTKPGLAARVVEKAAVALDGLDTVVHCAGIGLIRSAADTTDAEVTQVLNVNARATFLLAQAACQTMAAARRGRFLTIPGILGRAPMRNAAAYVASKYAVSGMIKAFAQEYQRHGIQFSLFHFGGVDSPFWDDLGMKVQREKMIDTATAAEMLAQTIDLPSHLVLGEVVLQPESHQLV